MIKILSSILFFLFLTSPSYGIQTVEGHKFSYSSKKKAYLIVNIATRCGYTNQLDGLEKIYQKYQKKGLEIIGVPSNDFGGQTPEKNSEVKKFCKLNYGVTFPLTEKVVVSGKDKDKFIADLINQTKGKTEIRWNFEKFLVLSNGKLLKRFPSTTDPLSKEFQKEIIKALR